MKLGTKQGDSKRVEILPKRRNQSLRSLKRNLTLLNQKLYATVITSVKIVMKRLIAKMARKFSKCTGLKTTQKI